MANEINEEILQAIDTIATSRINSASFDKTIEGRIIASLDNNSYTVLINGQTYSMSSYGNTTFKTNDTVNILYPQNVIDKAYIVPKGGSSGDTPIAYVLPVASDVLGGIKSGTDITVDSSGNVSVNDDSHNHIISNVDGLQSALDGKEATITKNTAFNIDFETNVTDIKMNGTQSLGVLSTVARADHIHPVDTSRAAVSHTHTSSAILDFAATVRTVVLTGLSTATNAVISASDTVLGALGKLQKQIYANLTTLTNHINNTNNPHDVTKIQVGLSNVDNTSDANKPISTASQTALDLKIDNSRINDSGTTTELWTAFKIQSEISSNLTTSVLQYNGVISTIPTTVIMDIPVMTDYKSNGIEVLLLRGSRWDKSIHGIDYVYGFISETQLQIEFLNVGTYKVNYAFVSTGNVPFTVISETQPIDQNTNDFWYEILE